MFADTRALQDPRSRDELAHRERLDEVIVPARAQAGDLIIDIAERALQTSTGVFDMLGAAQGLAGIARPPDVREHAIEDYCLAVRPRSWRETAHRGRRSPPDSRCGPLPFRPRSMKRATSRSSRPLISGHVQSSSSGRAP